ncbi:MAG: hypothetical protein AAF845_19855 [Bacteroidota bacterium]
MPERCIWTFQRDDRVIPVTVDAPALFGGRALPRTFHVLPEHEADLRAYLDLAARYGRPMLGGVLGLTAAIVGVAVLAVAFGWPDRLVAVAVGALTAGIGLVLIALPFVTPQTVMAFGLQSSVRIARWVGGLTVAVGGVIAVLG